MEYEFPRPNISFLDIFSVIFYGSCRSSAAPSILLPEKFLHTVGLWWKF